MARSSIAYVLALLACFLLASTSLRAQQLGTGQVRPLTDKTTFALGEESQWHKLGGPDVAVLGQREFLVTWDVLYEYPGGSQPSEWGTAISGRKVTLQGQPAAQELVLEPFEQSYQRQGTHRLAADAEGRFATFWHEFDSSEFLLRLFNPDGDPLETARLESISASLEPSAPRTAAVAMDPSGAISAAWLQEKEGFDQTTNELWVQLFDANLAPVGGSFQVRVPPQGANPPALAMARGNTILVDHFLVGDDVLLAVQRFDAQGRPLGRKIPVADGSTDRNQPAIAANAEGRFVVVWRDNFGIGARLFDASGRRVGPLIRAGRAAFADLPDVAMDSRGNFVVIWQVDSQDQFHQIRTRLFNREGVPQGGETIVAPDLFNQSYYFFGIPPAVALSDAGTFLVSWATDAIDFPEQYVAAVQGRTYTVLRDDDRCVWRDGTFLCDTARDGHPAHLELPFGASGDRPLLADFDGDGIDNACVRRGNKFLCDTDGQGAATLVLRFSTSQYTPLAGDLDGDGDDDPCVRRGRAFLCDTAHNGGGPEVNIPLGIDSDEPALGDVDGDGDDDPCVWRLSTGTFRCDTTHDGSLDLAQAVDAQPGDRPLLGDVDGDGHADLCFARGEALLCDLDRDSVLTEETLATKPGDLPLLGNVDGV